MATTVLRLFAALAAVLISLSGCGGGDESSVQPSSQETVLALSGPAVDRGTTIDGQPRMKALAASTSKTTEFAVSFTARVVSDAAVSGFAAAAVGSALSITDDQLFDWAEEQYASYFPSHEQTLTAVAQGNTYHYRFYPATGNYVARRVGGSDDGGIYVLGPFTDNTILRVDHASDYTCLVDVTVCAPKVESANLVSVTTGQVVANVLSGNPTVHARNSKLVVKWRQSINCTGIGGTLELGNEPKILVTVSCSSLAGTITLTPVDSWLYGTVDTLTLSGITSRDGYVSAPVTVNFTTKAVTSVPTLYVSNMVGSEGQTPLWSFDPTWAVAKAIDLPSENLSFGPIMGMMVDPLAGQLLVMPWIAHHIYGVDLETQTVISYALGDSTVGYVTEGLFLRGNDFCSALTRSLPWGVVNNQLGCWSRTTKERSFTTANDFLAETAMRTLKMRLVPTPTPKVYLVNGVHDAYDNSTGNWLPGTKGELRVLNPTTFALERKVPVGSVPVDFAVNPTSGDVWVINGGDRSLSIVQSSDRRAEDVETISLIGYDTRENQRPSGILIDAEKQQVFITDGYRTVFVYDAVTRQEKARIAIGPEYGPVSLLWIGSDVYVANLHYEGGLLQLIDRDTWRVTRTHSGFGLFPTNAVLFAP